MEVFLVPHIGRRTGVRLSLSWDGLKACNRIITGERLEVPWDGVVKKSGTSGAWLALFRISISNLARSCRGSGPAWGVFIGRMTLIQIIGFQEWRAAGMDKGSVIADPLFMDPGKSDFRLRKHSPALKIGFVPFDLAAVGSRPEFARP